MPVLVNGSTPRAGSPRGAPVDIYPRPAIISSRFSTRVLEMASLRRRLGLVFLAGLALLVMALATACGGGGEGGQAAAKATPVAQACPPAQRLAMGATA